MILSIVILSFFIDIPQFGEYYYLFHAIPDSDSTGKRIRIPWNIQALS